MVLFFTIVFFICLLKTYLSIFQANLDLIDGRFALFMDEQVLYDGVKSILHPETIHTFWFSVFDANAHLYGRIYWNINAIIGFLPDYLFGPTGLIFSGRISSVVFLSLSCFFLSFSFLKNWFFRLLSFFVLINIPFSSYFMTMPKPDPLQMFFLSLFLFLLKKSSFSLTKKSWFFFGLAIGTKVSILPIAFPIVVFSIYQSSLSAGINKALGSIPTMVGYLLLGLSVAVPILIKPYIVSYAVYRFANRFFFKKQSKKAFNGLVMVFSFLFANVIYTVLSKRLLGFKTGLYKWFTQTILNTGHGFDSADIGFFTWVTYFFTEYVSLFPFVNVFLFACAGLLVLLTGATNKDLDVNRNSTVLESGVFLLSGLALFLVVFSTANRIWGFYLFPAFSLLVVNMISICEVVTLSQSNLGRQTAVVKSTTKQVALVFLALLLSIVLSSWFPKNLSQYKKLANRTKTEDYRKNHRSSLQINEKLIVLSKEKNRKINVKNIGSPFVPDNGQYFSIIGLERPFTEWWAKHEILLVKGVREVLVKDLNINLLNYDGRVLEKREYDKWVEDSNEPCLAGACYKRIETFENGTELLILVSSEKNDNYKE